MGSSARRNESSTLPVFSSPLLHNTDSISFPQVELATRLHYSRLGAGHEAGVAPWVTPSDQLSMLSLRLSFDIAPQGHLIGGGSLSLQVYHGAPSSKRSIMLPWARGALPGIP